jgi:hypothetical protein
MTERHAVIFAQGQALTATAGGATLVETKYFLGFHHANIYRHTLGTICPPPLQIRACLPAGSLARFLFHVPDGLTPAESMTALNSSCISLWQSACIYASQNLVFTRCSIG